MASIPDESFNRSAAQLFLGFGMYAWAAYYACLFLPYRVLYDEYQSYERRTAQVCILTATSCRRFTGGSAF